MHGRANKTEENKSMKKSVSTFIKFVFILTIWAATFAIGVSADTPASDGDKARLPIEEGVFYRISNKTSDGYLTVSDGQIDLKDEKSAGAVFMFVPCDEEGYNILVISDSVRGYLSYSDGGVSVSEAANEGACFLLDYNGERFSILSAEAKELALCAVKENKKYEARISSETGDACLWKISEYTPEVFGLSQYSIKTKPYTSYNDLRCVVTPSYLGEFVEWESDDRNVLIVDNDGKFCALTEGDCTVYARLGGNTLECSVNVSYSNGYAWFSQNNMTSGGWNGGDLSGLYFRSGGVRKRFGFNGSTKNNDWMSEGCAICSIAQVLNNMGARLTEGYDLRSGLEGNLMADPYTVALANTDNYGPKSVSTLLLGDPVFSRHRAIAEKFNVNGAKVSVTVQYTVTKKTIKEALDKSPWGVVVCFKNSAHGTHYVTFNKCLNPDAENWRDYVFTVSDPVSNYRYDSDNVIFEESYSYKRLYYRFSNAYIMQVWDYEK